MFIIINCYTCYLFVQAKKKRMLFGKQTNCMLITGVDKCNTLTGEPGLLTDGQVNKKNPQCL